MKKLSLVFAVVAITAGAYAQTDSTTRMNQPNINIQDDKSQSWDNTDKQNQNIQSNPVDVSFRDGVTMQNGKVMNIINGKSTILDRELTLGNGTKVMANGAYIKKDGTRLMLKEGQQLDMSGNLVTKTNKDKNIYLVPDSTKKKVN